MNCPYCNEELVRYWGMKEPALYCCDNPKCSRGGVATERSWQELTKTKQALDKAIEALKEINSDKGHDYMASFEHITFVADQALDQIKQITESRPVNVQSDIKSRPENVQK